MNYKYILLPIVAVIILSCEQEEISPNSREQEEISSNTLYAKEIIDPTCYKDLFEYENGHLIQFKRLFGERTETTTRFHYFNNQLTKIEISRDMGLEQIIELTYGENGLRKEEKVTTKSNGVTTQIKIGSFSYIDGILKSIKYSSDEPSYLPTETVFEWSNDNIIKMDSYMFDGEYTYLTSSEIMTYDDKRSYSNQDIAFIYRVMDIQEINVSKNNLINKYVDVGSLIVNRESYEYTYNNNEYPTGYNYTIDSQQYNPIQINYK